jgi:hypothetical protein
VSGRSLLRLLSVLLALGLVALGTLSIVGSLARDSKRFERTYSGVAIVDLDVGVESVEVVAEAGASTTLERSVSWSLGEASISQRLVGERLVIRSSCPLSIGRGCGGHVRVVVPPSTEVHAESSAASVRAVGLTGTVDLSSSAGSVEGTALKSPDVTASSSAGSTRLSFAVAPTRVQVSSSAGSVEVLVPRGPEAYLVDAGSSAGSSDVAVRADPAASRSIDASSSAGSVRVGYIDRC